MSRIMNIPEIRADVHGFDGRFFADAERGDIGYIAKDCDDKQCDCEVKVNDDGDQDCSHSLYDWEHEDHINEPIARMLNAVGPLCDEITRLEALCDASSHALLDIAGKLHSLVGSYIEETPIDATPEHDLGVIENALRCVEENKRLRRLLVEACDIAEAHAANAGDVKSVTEMAIADLRLSEIRKEVDRGE